MEFLQWLLLHVQHFLFDVIRTLLKGVRKVSSVRLLLRQDLILEFKPLMINKDLSLCVKHTVAKSRTFSAIFVS